MALKAAQWPCHPRRHKFIVYASSAVTVDPLQYGPLMGHCAHGGQVAACLKAEDFVDGRDALRSIERVDSLCIRLHRLAPIAGPGAEPAAAPSRRGRRRGQGRLHHHRRAAQAAARGAPAVMEHTCV